MANHIDLEWPIFSIGNTQFSICGTRNTGDVWMIKRTKYRRGNRKYWKIEKGDEHWHMLPPFYQTYCELYWKKLKHEKSTSTSGNTPT